MTAQANKICNVNPPPLQLKTPYDSRNKRIKLQIVVLSFIGADS